MTPSWKELLAELRKLKAEFYEIKNSVKEEEKR